MNIHDQIIIRKYWSNMTCLNKKRPVIFWDLFLSLVPLSLTRQTNPLISVGLSAGLKFGLARFTKFHLGFELVVHSLKLKLMLE